MLIIFTLLADKIVFDWLKLDIETHIAKALHFFIEDTTKILFLVFALVFIIGFFRSWLAPEKIRLWLEGKSRFIAYILAAILGAITPFCSCSSIPLFIAFLSSGIPLGVTMVFLITSPMVNEVAAVLFGEAIGWTFTFSYVGVGIGVGIVGGFLVDLLKLEKWVEPFVFNIKPSQNVAQSGLVIMPFKERVNYAKYEALDIVKRIWLYVLLGVGVGAFIHGYIPQEWFIEHANKDNLLAVPLAVIIAIPLYSNVTGAVPVASVLIAKGLPVGTTLAFIMSTVAISFPEMIILRKVLKPQMIAFFIVYLAVAFIIIGYLFNFLF